MDQNVAKIIVSVLGGVVALIIEYWRIFRKPLLDIRTKEKPEITNADSKTAQEISNQETKPVGSTNRTRDLIQGILIGLIAAIAIWAIWSLIDRALHPAELSLWSFDQNTQSWQPEKHDVKPEDVATRVSWHSSPNALQGEFDFSQVKLGTLSGGKEPRATYYIDPVKVGDWSAFRTLNFDVENTSGHDLKVTFSISIDGCWYEFGEYQPLPVDQKSSLQFDLTEAQYKTCRVPDKKDNPPVAFRGVWRFDIIFGTPESPWDQVKGSILISNIKLTDRIPDAK